MLTKDIQAIYTELRNNRVVSIPTDTVYGLSCIISKIAIDKVINLKKRDSSKGFIIISHNYKHLLKYADISKLTKEQIKKISTKQETPTTWIVPGKNSIQWLTGGKPTIAIRLVDTNVVKDICSNIDDAIISTSANISGQDFINNPENINKTFSNIHVLKTQAKASQPSKIIDIITGQRIR
ncbi:MULTISPECIES: L-threonylcarbamoyladenylate synthase [unclassified Francisella]|uniref:L-threonylcarbamoyladenylate synthase n=1 Tax=unclassified Francisella TaxID=2610885 RepID=UPI002E2F7067|nr:MULTISPECIES: Sua5/YciO/YrdC/YwlC family protein [unclassified Francisella]MED7820240.1 Sua5/YciO/YrdC/YwlC family protein [Francisella sp. 19S2-4]MED7831065.1 Sua5/YciO/YrdC/YwlC family protein [Francisella sp. 19S2-10]